MADTGLSNLQGLNPLLSNMIVCVGGDQNFIAEEVLPVIQTEAEVVTYRKGANEHLVSEADTETLRGVGMMPREIDVTFSTGTVTLLERMLGANLDYRETQAANANPSAAIDIKLAKLSAVKSKILLSKESHVATALFTAANYTNTVNTVDFAATGLRATVLAAKETVRKSSGYEPNTLVLGVQSEIELLSNPDILDMIKYSAGGVTTRELFARFFGVDRVIVGSAVKQTAAAAGAAGTGSYVWTADCAALLYVNRNAPSAYNPSFSYLFQQPEKVFEWNNNPIVTNMAYGQAFVAPVMFSTAGYLWENTDQA
jgi:hypothetical protein